MSRSGACTGSGRADQKWAAANTEAPTRTTASAASARGSRPHRGCNQRGNRSLRAGRTSLHHRDRPVVPSGAPGCCGRAGPAAGAAARPASGAGHTGGAGAGARVEAGPEPGTGAGPEPGTGAGPEAQDGVTRDCAAPPDGAAVLPAPAPGAAPAPAPFTDRSPAMRASARRREAAAISAAGPRPLRRPRPCRAADAAPGAVPAAPPGRTPERVRPTDPVRRDTRWAPRCVAPRVGGSIAACAGRSASRYPGGPTESPVRCCRPVAGLDGESNREVMPHDARHLRENPPSRTDSSG